VAASFSEAWTQFGNAAKILQHVYDAGSVDSPNYLGLEDTYIQALKGDYALDADGARRAIRASLSGALSPDRVQAFLLPHLRDAAAAVDIVETDPARLIARLRDYMQTNSQTLNRREITYDSTATAGGANVGNGAILRLTTDEFGEPLEACHIELKTFECVADARQVDEHTEVFECRGEPAERDFLKVDGSGEANKRQLRASDARESAILLSNPSFSSDAVSATPTSITGWTVNTIGNVEVDSVRYYRDYVGDTTPRSLKITGNVTISQILQDVTRARLSWDVPYWLQVAVFRETGATGNFTLRLGATTRTVALSTLTENVWNVVRIVATPSEVLYLRTFNEANLDVYFAVDTLAVANVQIDDVLLVPFKRFDGHWYVGVPNAASNTPWQRLDTISYEDTIAADGVNQYWLWRAGLGYLPSATGGVETIVDIA